MIHALRYEPRGQRQRFEPREQQSRNMWHRHLHLHLHVGRWVRLNSHPTVAGVTRIFAAFMGALSMALTLKLQTGARRLPLDHLLFTLAGHVIFAGALLGLGAVLLGGIPLVVSARPSTPRSRFLFRVPGITIVLALLYFMLISFVQQMTSYALNNLGHTFNNILLALPFYGVPIISTIAINRAVRRAALSDKWLRFANMLSPLVVLGMLLMLSGTLLWGFALALFAPGWFVVLLPLLTFPWNSWLLIFLGMLIAVIVALWALFSRPGSREQAEARPKDDSPAEFDSFEEPRAYRG